jgi:hypothetical protein
MTLVVDKSARPFGPSDIGKSAAEAGPQIGKTIKMPDSGEPETEVDDEAKKDFCPACGTNLKLLKEREVDDEDKNRWLRHILGEGRFSKTYDLYGGQIIITLQTRTVSELEAVFEQLKREPVVTDGTLLGVEPEFLSKLNGYMLVYALESVSGVEVPPYKAVTEENYPAEGDDDKISLPVARAYRERLASLSPALLASMGDCLVDFDHLTTTLRQHGADSDFWLTTGEST